MPFHNQVWVVLASWSRALGCAGPGSCEWRKEAGASGKRKGRSAKIPGSGENEKPSKPQLPANRHLGLWAQFPFQPYSWNSFIKFVFLAFFFLLAFDC